MCHMLHLGIKQRGTCQIQGKRLGNFGLSQWAPVTVVLPVGSGPAKPNQRSMLNISYLVTALISRSQLP